MKKPWLFALLLLPALHPRPASALDEVTATDIVTGLVPIGGLVLTYSNDDPAGRRQYFWSMATSMAVVNGSRLAFKDHEWATRPNGHPYGFPSGHMAFLGAGAAFLQDRYGWKWGVPAWAATGYTAWVRVDDDHHRWRDIVAALVVVEASSLYFTTRFPDMTVKPLFGDEYQKVAGLQVEYRFAAR